MPLVMENVMEFLPPNTNPGIQHTKYQLPDLGNQYWLLIDSHITTP